MFDFTGIHRARLFEGIEISLKRAYETANDNRAGQFFDLMGDSKLNEHP